MKVEYNTFYSLFDGVVKFIFYCPFPISFNRLNVHNITIKAAIWCLDAFGGYFGFEYD